MNNEQAITNNAPSLDRYNNIPVLGHTQIIPTNVIVEQATQVVPTTQVQNNQQVMAQQIVPVDQVFTQQVNKQVIVQQPYQSGAVTISPQQVVSQAVPQVQQVVSQTAPQVQQQVQSNTLIDDSMLQKEFIGKNYEKIMNSQFNIFAALFSFFYFFYRKMYLYGVILSLFMFIILVLTRSIIIGVVLCGLIGLITNVIYRHFSLRKVQDIRENNEDKDVNEIINICKEEGNTSIASIIFGVMAEGIAGAIIGILVFIFLLSKVNL